MTSLPAAWPKPISAWHRFDTKAWRIDDGLRRYFVKTNEVATAPMFAAEVQGMRELSATAVVRTPTFVTLGETDIAIAELRR